MCRTPLVSSTLGFPQKKLTVVGILPEGLELFARVETLCDAELPGTVSKSVKVSGGGDPASMWPS